MKRLLPTWILVAVAAVVLPGVAHARTAIVSAGRGHHRQIPDAFRSGTLAPRSSCACTRTDAAYDQAGPQLNSFMHVNEHAVSAARP